jgi:hypothetical protein
MDKQPVLRKIWCANNWVGAPWACGNHSKENFEANAVDMYAGQGDDMMSNTTTTNLPNCTGTLVEDCLSENSSKKCTSRYVFDNDSCNYFQCAFNEEAKTCYLPPNGSMCFHKKPLDI